MTNHQFVLEAIRGDFETVFGDSGHPIQGMF